MSKNIERPTAVWRGRHDISGAMECSNCGAEAHYQIVDGVWRYEPYCAHCGARVYEQEDLPMSGQPSVDDTSIPFVCQRLGILPEQPFVVNGYPDRTFPVLVYQNGQIRRYIPGARNKGHKLGGGAICWLMEHPEAVTMRQAPITENDVSKGDDMSENKTPRLAEVLGVEVGEKFDIDDDFCNPFYVNEEGYLLDSSGYRRSDKAVKIINNPDLIQRRPRWTEQEVKDAKNIIRMFGADNFTHVTKNENGWPVLADDYEECANFTIGLEKDIFPSVKPGQTVKLSDIIGGNE